MMKTISDFIRRKPLIVTIAVLLGIGGFIFFLNIIEDVMTGDTGPVDKEILLRAGRLAQSSDGRWLTPVAKAISLVGNWQVIVPLGVLLLLLAAMRRIAWRDFLFFIVACAGSAALILGLKFLIARPRPQIVPALEKAPFLSFPSGHSVYALVGWGFVAYLIARRPQTSVAVRVLLAVVTTMIALLVGASRIYLAAHYPSDVAGGLLLGVPWLIAVVFMYENSLRKKPHNEAAGKVAA